MNRFLISTILLFLFLSCKEEKPDQTIDFVPEKSKPLNIILMIGDGMGLSQISSTYFYGEKEPNFSRFSTIGLSMTSSSSHKITDSAAGATAFSTGKKTYNGAIGVDTNKHVLTSIIELLSEKDYSTGIVSTSSITHATPASFYAHVDSRKKEFEIATQLVTSSVDFFAGGGIRFFNERPDSLNYLDSLITNGFLLDTNSLSNPITDYNSKYAFLLSPEGLITKPEGRKDFLINASQKALDYLSKKNNPFFLMVEGSQIDWGGHANDADYLIQETIDFDKTIGKVLDFAEKDGNTLVIVTADHETGGFTLAGKPLVLPLGQKGDDYNDLDPRFSTGGHSATLVPVFAFGKGSELFNGCLLYTSPSPRD